MILRSTSGGCVPMYSPVQYCVYQVTPCSYETCLWCLQTPAGNQTPCVSSPFQPLDVPAWPSHAMRFLHSWGPFREQREVRGSAPDREQEKSKDTILDSVSGYCLAWRWYLELLQALIANLKRKPTFLRQGNLRPWGYLEPLSPSVLKTLLWWLHVIGENSIFVVMLVG